MSVAELIDVEVAYGGRGALGPFSLALAAGEIVALVGPSGCGKSTALRLLAGLEAPQKGQVRRGARPGETAVVFQSPTLAPWLTAQSNVALPLELSGVSKREARERADAALARVGLSGREAARPAQLSGGMAMRVSLARALVTSPRLLLLDEPFAALDEITRAGMRYLLLDVWTRTGATCLFVTHSIEEAVLLSDRVAVMTPRPGRIAHVETITLPRPRPAGIEDQPEFHAHVATIRRTLRGAGA